jgi:hypothetical protein
MWELYEDERARGNITKVLVDNYLSTCPGSRGAAADALRSCQENAPRRAPMVKVFSCASTCQRRGHPAQVGYALKRFH